MKTIEKVRRLSRVPDKMQPDKGGILSGGILSAPFDHGGHCPLYSGGSKTVVASMMKYDH